MSFACFDPSPFLWIFISLDGYDFWTHFGPFWTHGMPGMLWIPGSKNCPRCSDRPRAGPLPCWWPWSTPTSCPSLGRKGAKPWRMCKTAKPHWNHGKKTWTTHSIHWFDHDFPKTSWCMKQWGSQLKGSWPNWSVKATFSLGSNGRSGKVGTQLRDLLNHQLCLAGLLGFGRNLIQQLVMLQNAIVVNPRMLSPKAKIADRSGGFVVISIISISISISMWFYVIYICIYIYVYICTSMSNRQNYCNTDLVLLRLGLFEVAQHLHNR